MKKREIILANILTAHCETCKAEREFYDLEDVRVCTRCLRSEIIQKKTGNQKELFA